ncbi:uncharacterized membrane protein HdeD (DUF308 family) [Kitasatospora sp. MAP12-15]|uniref:HdeD family acid-resistance protein n=1 Tax=unclassified Kitasatospora TaxID=2633591 RepID=UPI0024761472|nr:DUF308 domain-containing protein [Kitasatospora sp. MAP12-44]MDH6115194.1 uncharacterized membrane protein HdeD (DUF308 family) [Kitasatospora sp. MAP12-44]
MTTPLESAAQDPQDLLAGLGKSWQWAFGFGVLTIVAGIVLLCWPEETTRVVAIIIGLQLLVAGVARFVTAFSHDGSTTGARAMYVFLSLLSIIAGVLCLRHQVQTVALLALVVGVFWLVGGVVTLFVALTERDLPSRGLSIFVGLLGTVAGIFVLSYPVESAVALARLLGVWLLLLGLVEAGVALMLRSVLRRTLPREP